MVWTLKVIISFLVSWFDVHVSHLLLFWAVFNSWVLRIVLRARWLIFWVPKTLECTYITLIEFGQLYFRTCFSDNSFSLYTIIVITRFRSRTLAESERELFLIIVSSFQPLALVLRKSILRNSWIRFCFI